MSGSKGQKKRGEATYTWAAARLRFLRHCESFLKLSKGGEELLFKGRGKGDSTNAKLRLWGHK